MRAILKVIPGALAVCLAAGPAAQQAGTPAGAPDKVILAGG
jgi:hypothetical protein